MPTEEEIKSNVEATVTDAEAKVKKVQEQIASLQAGQTTDQLQETGEFTMPEADTTAPDMSAVNAELAKLREQTSQEEGDVAQRLAAQEAEKKAEEARIEAERKEQPWYKKIGTRTPEEVRTAAFQEAGITVPDYLKERQADLAGIASIQEEYRNLEQQRNDAVSGAELRLQGFPEGILRGEKAIIERQYNSRLATMSAKIKDRAAIMEAKQGNFALAQNYANQAVQDYMWETNLNLKLMEDFEDRNQEVLDELDDEYKNILNEYKLNLQNEADKTEQEKRDVMNLGLDNLNAGITIDDTLEEAYAKVQAVGGVVDTKAPTTKEVGGVLYQWDAGAQTWIPATGVTPEEKGFTQLEQVKIDQGLADDIAGEKGALYKKIGQAKKGEIGLGPLADIAISAGASYEGFKSALLAHPKISIEPDGEVWFNRKWPLANTTIGTIDDIKDKFGETTTPLTPTATGATQEELNSIFFDEGEF